ncbi:uncharacterized protein PAC_18618 [Phialocephala subalpina]|uniref:Ubiquitin-like domain-containing protein n=1 Tax=Phialocephala subalpina TaxID=576137 RepID=A0A1L7XUL5_9HELO|nr:uncharacterized protein PAC_18618 [Phialocephala subalpina]
MSGPAFGFSVGDFISAISLIKTLISALNDSAGSKPQYQRLIEALFNLERALTEVKNLKVTASQGSQKIALEQVASQCQQSIERFLEDNAKFKDTLGLAASKSKWSWRTNLHKIQWALCKDEAIAGLRAEITGHTLTINTLLATIQLSSSFLQEETARNREIEARDDRALADDTNCIVRKNLDLLNTQEDFIRSIPAQISRCSTKDQSIDLRNIMFKLLDTNMKMHSILLDIHKLQQNIPPQIQLQQPVLFDDAHGRLFPFHMEFINSFEAFQAVIEVRFQHVPGLRKVQKNEYAVREHRTKRKINLKAPWESVFLPGRKFHMSMIFRQPQNPVSSCPGCQTENATSSDSIGMDIQW